MPTMSVWTAVSVACLLRPVGSVAVVNSEGANGAVVIVVAVCWSLSVLVTVMSFWVCVMPAGRLHGGECVGGNMPVP